MASAFGVWGVRLCVLQCVSRRVFGVFGLVIRTGLLVLGHVVGLMSLS